MSDCIKCGQKLHDGHARDGVCDKCSGLSSLAPAHGSANHPICKDCKHRWPQDGPPPYHPESWCYLFRDGNHLAENGYCGQFESDKPGESTTGGTLKAAAAILRNFTPSGYSPNEKGQQPAATSKVNTQESKSVASKTRSRIETREAGCAAPIG